MKGKVFGMIQGIGRTIHRFGQGRLRDHSGPKVRDWTRGFGRGVRSNVQKQFLG